MPCRPIAAAAVLAMLLPASGADACSAGLAPCRPVVVWPVYTTTGRRLGAVEARVERLPRLEASRFTGQPLTAMYNDPGSFPGAVDPGLTLVPLSRVPHRQTRAVYPAGY